MIRRLALISAMISTAAFAFTVPAFAQAKAQSDGVTIVIPLNALGSSRDASVLGMKSVIAVVSKQPGYIDGVLMEHKNSANKPSHDHVTRWRDMKNWEAVFLNSEFQKALKESAGVVQVQDAAGVYTPVK